MVEQTEEVLKYYESTFSDYKNLWTGRENLAIHFGYYDKKTKQHSKALSRLNEVLAGYAQISEQDKVIDAGCGYGGSAIWLAKNFGCNVTGVTIVPFQVSIGNEKISQLNLSQKVKLFNQDYSRTSFPDSSFSVYWALESFVHSNDRGRALGEAYRLLKIGGRIIVAEYTYREDPTLSREEKEYMEPWLKGWAMPKLLTASEYTKNLKLAGFTDIKTYDISRNVTPSLKHLAHWVFSQKSELGM